VQGPLTEDLPARATTKKGRIRTRMAQRLLAVHRSGTLQVAIARSSDYYGPGGANSFVGDILFGAAAQGKRARWLGRLDVPHSLNYLPDVARALATLGARPPSAPWSPHRTSRPLPPQSPGSSSEQTARVAESGPASGDELVGLCGHRVPALAREPIARRSADRCGRDEADRPSVRLPHQRRRGTQAKLEELDADLDEVTRRLADDLLAQAGEDPT
jgi:hypothetical protein